MCRSDCASRNDRFCGCTISSGRAENALDSLSGSTSSGAFLTRAAGRARHPICDREAPVNVTVCLLSGTNIASECLLSVTKSVTAKQLAANPCSSRPNYKEVLGRRVRQLLRSRKNQDTKTGIGLLSFFPAKKTPGAPNRWGDSWTVAQTGEHPTTLARLQKTQISAWSIFTRSARPVPDRRLNRVHLRLPTPGGPGCRGCRPAGVLLQRGRSRTSGPAG